MVNLNKVMIAGYLGHDVELKKTQNDKSVATFNVATTKFYNDGAGERQKDTEWHKVVVWEKLAENCAKYLKKGDPAFLEGSLKTKKFTDKNNIERYVTEIIAENVQFLAPKENPTNPTNPTNQASSDIDIPF